ncbi:MAG: DEAD/DEAH box helicase family protein [Candidatus Scalindua sp.]
MLNLIQQEDCPLNPHYFDMIVADESHRSIYNVYKNIFKLSVSLTEER